MHNFTFLTDATEINSSETFRRTSIHQNLSALNDNFRDIAQHRILSVAGKLVHNYYSITYREPCQFWMWSFLLKKQTRNLKKMKIFGEFCSLGEIQKTWNCWLACSLSLFTLYLEGRDNIEYVPPVLFIMLFCGISLQRCLKKKYDIVVLIFISILKVPITPG